MRRIIAAAAGALFAAVPGAANAGSITPIQYAYGGGSNAAAVIASQPPASESSQSTPAGGAAATGSGGAGSSGHRPGATAAQPLVGIAAAPAAPVGSFDALHRAIPRDALWAIALAAACALGAWLVRRGNA